MKKFVNLAMTVMIFWGLLSIAEETSRWEWPAECQLCMSYVGFKIHPVHPVALAFIEQHSLDVLNGCKAGFSKDANVCENLLSSLVINPLPSPYSQNIFSFQKSFVNNKSSFEIAVCTEQRHCSPPG